MPEAAYHRLHVTGTHNLLAALPVDNLPQCILHISSPASWGRWRRTGRRRDEDEPLAPSNPYERSKAAAEAVVAEFVAQGWPIVTIRPEFVYGPGDLHVLGLFRAIQRGIFFYIGAGWNQCHPTYIKDAAAGMLLALEQGPGGRDISYRWPRAGLFCYLCGDDCDRRLAVRPPWLRLPRGLAWLGASGLELAGNLLGFTPPLSRTGVTFFSESRRFSGGEGKGWT